MFNEHLFSSLNSRKFVYTVKLMFYFDTFFDSCFGSTGEASNVDEYLWLMGRAHYKPVIEYCGGTEIGGAFITGSLLQPQSLAAFSTAAMGCKLFILGEDGNPLVSNFLVSKMMQCFFRKILRYQGCVISFFFVFPCHFSLQMNQE